MAKVISLNALIAAVYGALSLILPATAFANYRLTTSLYVLASFNPSLIPGLALGNAIAGLPQGPLDVVMGGIVGLITAWLCSRLSPLLAPLVVLSVPTLLVPLWLRVIFEVPYLPVMLTVMVGQAFSTIIAYLVVVPLGRRLFPRHHSGAPYVES